MAKQVQHRRGTTVQHSSFTGAEGEITVDTDKGVAVIHDGSTVGGFPLALESVAGDALPKAGGEMSGNITMAGAETVDGRDLSVDGAKLDGIEALADVTDDANVRTALASATAEIAINTQKITGVVDPVADQDAATKAYVDSVANGLETKASVLVATTANITLSGTQTIDGVTVAVDDRVLAKDQTDETENGIYDVAAGAWSRSDDADNTPGGELGPGTFTFVEAGSTQADNGYVATGIATGTGALTGYFDLGTDDISFSQFSGAGQITAGTNLNKSGNTINLDTVLTNFESTGIDDNATSTAITIDSSENVGIGTTDTSRGAVTIVGSLGKLILGDSETDSTNKTSRFGSLHYTNAEEPIAGMILSSTATNNTISIGGSTNNFNAATIVRFYTASNNTTVTGTERMRINSSGNIGIGTTGPDGTLHVHTASAGSVTANTSADDLIIENSSNAGTSILNPDAGIGSIVFGTPGNSFGATIIWDYGAAGATTLFRLGPRVANGILRFDAGAGVEAARFDSSGNMGIGTTDPDGTLHVHTASAGVMVAAGDFEDLVVEGSNSTGLSILCPDANLAGIAFGTPADNLASQIVWDASNSILKIATRNSGAQLRFDTADGVEAVRIDSSGNMGIGGIPDALFHVDSDQNLALADDSENLLARVTDTFVDGTNTINFDIINRAHTTRDSVWHNSATRLESRIDNSSTANSWIEFRHYTTSANSAIAFGEGSGDSGQWMTINEGLVGIGIDTPDGTLHVHTASAGSVTAHVAADDLVVENDDDCGISILVPNDKTGYMMFGQVAGNFRAAVRWDATNLIMRIGPSVNSGQLRFDTANGAEAMRINSSGSLLVGATSTTDAHRILSSTGNKFALLVQNDNASTPFGLKIDFNGTTPDNNTQQFLSCQDQSGTRLLIYADGDVVNHDNSYGAISDQKLKQDISLAGSQWDDVKQLGSLVKKFRMITDVEADSNAPYKLGFVAQDIEPIAPGLVKNNPDLNEEPEQVLDENGDLMFDENGDPVMELDRYDLGTVTKSVKYSVAYMKAFKALGEALERIEALEAKVADLEANHP